MSDDRIMPAVRAGLDRCLGTIGVLFLTLSVATPASSVFVIVPGMLQVAGTGALLAMLLAGIVCLATAFIYAELSSAWPVAGGEYVMVARTLGPMAGFAMLGVDVFMRDSTVSLFRFASGQTFDAAPAVKAHEPARAAVADPDRSEKFRRGMVRTAILLGPTEAP